MINRYSIVEISKIWDELTKYNYYFKVEKILAEVLGEKNIIDPNLSFSLENISLNLESIHEIEKHTGHDVIAFCQSIENNLPEQLRSYFHFGVTSSDIIDTALMLQMRDSNDLLVLELKKLIAQIDNQIHHL